MKTILKPSLTIWTTVLAFAGCGGGGGDGGSGGDETASYLDQPHLVLPGEFVDTAITDSNILEPKMAMNPSGQGILVAESDGEILGSLYLDGQLHPVVKISTFDEGTNVVAGTAEAPAVAFDGDRHSIVAWRQQARVTTGEGIVSQHFRTFAREYRNGTWGSAYCVDPNLDSADDLIPSVDLHDPCGWVIAFIRRNDTTDSLRACRSDRPLGSVELDSFAKRALLSVPQVALDGGNNNGIVVWDTPSGVSYRRFSNGGNWESAAALSGLRNPQVRFVKYNEALILCEGTAAPTQIYSYPVYMNDWADVSPTLVVNDALAGTLRLAVAFTGASYNASLLWERVNGLGETSIQCRRFRGVWTDTVTLASGMRGSAHASLSVSSAAPTSFWTVRSSTILPDRAIVQLIEDGTAHGAVAVSSEGRTPHHPTIAALPAGAALAAWSEWDGSQYRVVVRGLPLVR